MPLTAPRRANGRHIPRSGRRNGFALTLVLAWVWAVADPGPTVRVWAASAPSAQAPSAQALTEHAPAGQPPASVELAALLAHGEAGARTGRFLEAEPELRRAITLAHGLGNRTAECRALRWLAEAELGLGRDAMALTQQLLRTARQAGDREHEGWARANLAHAALYLDDKLAAEAGYRRALELFASVHCMPGVARATLGLGRVASASGRHDEAMRRYLEADSLSALANEPRLHARSLSAMGTLVFYSDPGRSLELWRQSVAACDQVGDVYGAMIPLTNIAVAGTHAGRFDEATAALNRVIAASEAGGYLNEQQFALRQLGIVRRLQGRLDESVQLLRRSFEIPTGDLGDRVFALQQIAQTTLSLGRPAEALAEIDRGVQSFTPTLLPERRRDLFEVEGQCLQALGRPREALARFLAFSSGDQRMDAPVTVFLRCAPAAECYRDLGQPDSALIMLARASAAWESLRAVPKDAEWRTQRSVLAARIYGTLVSVLLVYPDSLTAGERARRAFDAVQPFKARALLERLSGPGRPSASGSNELTPITAAKLQREVLRPGELFLDTFVGGGESFLFAITRDTLVAATLPAPAELLTGVHDYLAVAGVPPQRRESDPERAVALEAGGAIGRELLLHVGPLASHSRHVIIACDGSLPDLPIGALPALGVTHQPLLAGREVSYVPSATVLAALRARAPRAERGLRTLVLAGRTGSAGELLPGAMEEARWVAGRYRHSDLIVGGGDSTYIRDRLPQYDVIHLASHIRRHGQSSWETAFVLTGGARGIEDSTLTAARIAMLDLPARLCVLAGCSSAEGTHYGGEGAVTLASSFVRAGVPCVVASLWPVDDRVTGRLVRRFYENLERGATVGEALRQAQLWIRRSPGTRHPFYWAGLIVIGDADTRVPLELKPWRLLPLSVPALLLALAIGWLLNGWFGAKRPVTATARGSI